ncbi:hypothetical protein BH20ACT23_BH20ACT23_23800 [soil metagenome]
MPPHAITKGERAVIVKAAHTKRLADLRHRKLIRTLSRQDKVFWSPSTTLWVLRAETALADPRAHP